MGPWALGAAPRCASQSGTPLPPPPPPYPPSPLPPPSLAGKIMHDFLVQHPQTEQQAPRRVFFSCTYPDVVWVTAHGKRYHSSPACNALDNCQRVSKSFCLIAKGEHHPQMPRERLRRAGACLLLSLAVCPMSR